jgi:hypothetical protein
MAHVFTISWSQTTTNTSHSGDRNEHSCSVDRTDFNDYILLGHGADGHYAVWMATWSVCFEATYSMHSWLYGQFSINKYMYMYMLYILQIQNLVKVQFQLFMLHRSVFGYRHHWMWNLSTTILATQFILDSQYYWQILCWLINKTNIKSLMYIKN